MKTLYLLRHAKAEGGGSGGDKLRKLSEQGLADAAALGAIMRRKEYVPEYILCSPATRTKQTLEGVCKGGLSCPPADEPEALYNAATGVIFSLIQQVDDSHDSLLVVAHNPGIHDVAARLAAEESPPSHLSRLFSGYKPGTLTVLECDIEKWPEINLASNMVKDILEPLDYNAPATPARWT